VEAEMMRNDFTNAELARLDAFEQSLTAAWKAFPAGSPERKELRARQLAFATGLEAIQRAHRADLDAVYEYFVASGMAVWS
jgi:hypothetical protein